MKGLLGAAGTFLFIWLVINFVGPIAALFESQGGWNSNFIALIVIIGAFCITTGVVLFLRRWL